MLGFRKCPIGSILISVVLREISSAVEHLVYTEIVTSSILVSPMKHPIQFENVLPVDVFYDVNDELKDWRFNNSSNSDDDSKTFFGQRFRFDRLTYYKAATITTLKIKKHLRKDLRLVRIHSGGKVFGSRPNFHKDYKEKYQCYTFILFTRTNWNTNWGGEFVVQDPTGKYHHTSYIPNSGVLIPSHWEHTGNPPLTPEAGIRTSVAFMYTHESNYNYVIDNHPEDKLFS